MKGLITAAVTRARTVFLIFALILIAGGASYMTIPKESSPDISLPIIYVSLSHEGISPEDAVNLLVKPIELEVRGIEGLDELEATAFEGGANVILRFQAGFDSDQALADVRNKVDLAKAELPDEADEPKVNEVNFSLFPVLSITIAGELTERQLKRLAEDLQDRIEGISGVLEAKISGLREEQLLIEVDRDKLQSYDLSPTDFQQLIERNNRLVAAGSLEVEKGRYAVKVPGLFKTADDLLNLPVLTDGTRSVRIRDVADVKLTFKDTSTISRVDGKRSVLIEVSKRVGENIIETVDAVKQATRAEAKSWPEGVSFRFINDESDKIRQRLADLQNNVAMAVILVMIVVLAALGPRPALLVATTVPGSFLLAIMLLHGIGLTVNVVVLFALILSVGILVDGAIVVTELAATYQERGKNRKQAFIEAAQYMAWPIIASTATTLAAFMPLLFWPDIVGEFMKFMPITLIFTLSASLLMALIFLPTIGAYLPSGTDWKMQQQSGHLGVNFYEKMLRWAIARPGKVMIAVGLLFVLSVAAYAKFGRGVEFFPDIEPERANLLVHVKGDLSIAQQDEVMRKVQQRLEGLKGVATMSVTTGAAPDQQQRGPSDVIGNVFLEFEGWDNRSLKAHEILQEALRRTANMYGVRVEEQPDRAGPSSGKPIKLAITGPRFAALPPVVQKLEHQIKQIPGTKNVENNLPEPGIEWTLDIDRAEATRYGTSLAEAGMMVRLATTGAIIGSYRPRELNEELDITARFKEHQRDLSTIDNLKVVTPNGRVPISHFATRQARDKVTVVRRLDQKDTAYIEADVKQGYLADDIVKTIRTGVQNSKLPAGVNVEFKGEDEKQKEASAFLQKAFMIAIFIMAIILVTQFNSFYQAGIILTAVILSTTGVLLGHLITGKPFGIIMSGLGVISLAGIVVNNNIVLIDTYNKILAEKDNWLEALIETGKSRLRPVLLTAVTTIIGLLPMAAKINVDMIYRHVQYNAPSTQWWDQLASSIIFGLAFATILTLVVTPCLLALREQHRHR